MRLAAVMGCGFLRSMSLLGSGKGFSGVMDIQILKTFLKAKNFSTAAGSPDNNFFSALFGKFFSLSFQGFLGVKMRPNGALGILSVRLSRYLEIRFYRLQLVCPTWRFGWGTSVGGG